MKHVGTKSGQIIKADPANSNTITFLWLLSTLGVLSDSGIQAGSGFLLAHCSTVTSLCHLVQQQAHRLEWYPCLLTKEVAQQRQYCCHDAAAEGPSPGEGAEPDAPASARSASSFALSAT